MRRCHDYKVVPPGDWGTNNSDNSVIWVEFLPRVLIKNIRRQPKGAVLLAVFSACDVGSVEAVVDNPGFVRFQQECLRRFLASQYSEKPMWIRHLKPGTASEGRGGGMGACRQASKICNLTVATGVRLMRQSGQRRSPACWPQPKASHAVF